MNKQEFRQYSDGRVLALTGESPKKFKGQVFVGWTGTPNNLEEVVVPFGQLPPKISEVPDEWKNALKSKGFTFEAPRAPKEKEAPRERKTPREKETPKERRAPREKRPLPIYDDELVVTDTLIHRITFVLCLIVSIGCFAATLFLF